MSDAPLPAILDPLLDYLGEHLSPELFSFISSLLSYALTLFATFISLVSSLVASKPWEWDAQTIIPPLIAFLAVYLALVSLYRTTSWLFRTTFWVIKWGTILGVLAGGAGWYMGNQDVNGGWRGPLTGLGAVLNSLNSGARDGTRPHFPGTTSGTAKHHGSPWEFLANQWQYHEDNPILARHNDAQKIVSDIVAAANHALTEGGWWDVAKGLFAPGDPDSREERRSTRRKGGRSSNR